MGKRIEKIVNTKYHIPEESFTKADMERYMKARTADRIPWERIQCLIIFGTLADADRPPIWKQIPSGFYMDSWREGVVVVGIDNVQDYISRCTDKLKKLTIRSTNIIKLDLSQQTGLQLLDLRFAKLSDECDIKLPNSIEKMDLSNLQFSNLSGVQLPDCLEHLDISNTRLKSLTDMHLPDTIRNLILCDTQLSSLEDVHLPANLQALDLARTKINRLSDNICALDHLEYLNLAFLELEDLPDWLPKIGKISSYRYVSKGVSLYRANVANVDMTIFLKRQEMITQWFEARKRAREEEVKHPLNELKIIFLGDGEAGKSHTIARLLEDGKQVKTFRGDSTPGIVIEDKAYRLDDREVKVHYWDFGGQEILHSMHRMFLTKRTLYVVLLNVREGNQDDRARYWLHNLKSFADGAPVLLVLNKMDMNKNASINEADFRKLYPGLTDVVKLSTLTYSEEEFQKAFVDVLMNQIGAMDILAHPFVGSWNRLKEKLQDMERNYIFGDEFRAYCDEVGVKGSDAVRRDLLDWFSDLGVSFCYSDEDSMELEDHVVLKPDWITNAIYIILFNKVEAVNNGLVSHDTIYRMLSSEDTEKYRRTVAAATYKREEVDYVLKVFRKFRLSFLVEEGVEFLPMLCDANSTAAASEYENDPNALEFRMHYEYLPNNVIHRLMVDRRKELDRDNVWLTGARFACGDTGRSAVVKSEGNLIRILVRAEKDPRDPQRYLDELKESLERINAIMGLTVSSMEVIYKENGRSACFDYADLMFAQEIGETHIPCRELRKKIRLVDVLMQSDFPEDEKQKKLMADIRQACELLQNRKKFWDASEDERTDYLMDMLVSKDYAVLDQHRGGISAGGIQSGELDLDIRLTPGDAWSALEALNLKGSSDSQIKYWNAHLKKLLDNYNDVGRSFLFHVSYVQCPKDKFGKIYSDMYEHMRFYSPRGFELLRNFVSPVPLGTERDQNQFLRAVKCVYDCGGVTMTVYHFFVRIGE